MPEIDIIDLTPALRTWAYREGVTPTIFRKRMGFSSYDHAYRLVHRNGTRKFSDKAWGRFIWAFGMGPFREIIEIAKADLENPHG